MIVKESFLKKIRQTFDLNIYEAKLWTALLFKGISSAAELSDIGDVPRSRAYDVLESLEKKGFVIMKLGKPIRYVAIKPEEVIKRFKENIKIKAKERMDMVENVKNTEFYKDLNRLYKSGDVVIKSSSLTGAIKNRSNIYNHISCILKNAEKSVIIMTTSTGLKRKINNFGDIFKELSKRGVRIRIVAPVTEENIRGVQKINNFVEVKNLEPNARFVLVDGKELVFMLMDDKEVNSNYDTGIWVKSEMFVKALENMFNVAWKEG